MSRSIEVKNVVANTKIADEIDLKDLSAKLEGSDYNKERFPGVVYRISEPRAVFLIFSSGKVVTTGASSVESVYVAIDNLIEEFTEIGIDIVDEVEVTIQNIVSTADTGSKFLDLNSIALGLGLENIEYEPEIFPGLVYRMSDPKVVILVFGSGKLVITGAKKIEDCKRALDQLIQELEGIGLL
ncbi:MAG: TATA-box-binding protein [Halobacteriota archaeon]|nr:TATA-box-binding protein [Halobacteriota archaeon]